MKHNYLSGIIVMFLLAFSPGLLQARQSTITPTSGGEEVSFENIVVQYLPATDTPITQADNQGYGVSWLRFVFDNDANVLLNKNCPSPAVLTKEGDADFRWEIKADATWSQTTLAYPMFGNSADGNNLQLAFFIDLSNKITGEGTYKFTIPDGYVTSNGVKVNGTTFTYIVSSEGGDPVVEQKEFKSLVKEYLPAVDTPLAIADNQFGVSWLRYVFNTKVTLNTGCTSPILLTKEGDESVRVEIPADATMQSSSKIYPMVVNYTDGSPMLTLMIDYQNPIKGAGTYTVAIPDGYVQCDGVDVKGATFTYILQDEPVVAEKAFKDLVKQYLPAVDTPLAIADNQYGVSWLRYVLNTTVTLNKECASPAVLAKEGDASVRIEIPADAAYPATIYPAMGASMEGDPQLAFMIDFQNPIVSAGTYTVTIPDGYVKCDGVDVKGSTFTYIIEAAPVVEKTLKELVTEYLPAVDTPLPVADNKYGVSWLRYRLTDFVTVNKECTVPAVLTREGDDSFRIEVNAAASSMESNIYAATGWSGEIPQLTFMMDYQNAVTTPGTYCMTVPDGFLKLDGVDVKGSIFKYILVGSTPVEPKEFKSLVKEYLPATDTPLQVSENQFGVSWLRYVLNTAVALNTECASPIVLTKDGDESVRVEIPADATMQSPSKIYPLIANYTDGSPMLTLMIDYQNPIVAAGTYTVTIPDGYLKCEGADVKGASLKYILEGEPVVVPKEFKNIVKEYLPAVDTPLDVKDNQYGVSWLRYVLNTTVTLNTECASPVVLVKEGDESVRVEVPANATSNSSAIYPAVGTVNDNCQLTFMMDYQNPIVAPGTYIVTIPDGYLKCNDVDVKGASLKYILEDSSVPTEKVFDKMVTRYQPPVGTRFEAVEENQLGVSQLTYIMNAPIALNIGCASPAVLTKEGDESFRKEVSAGASYTASCYPFVGSYNGKPQVMFMIEYQDAITEAGTYYFEIPDGYFTSEGESVKGAKFTYYLGVDPGQTPVEQKAFDELVDSYQPPVETAFTAADDFELGMSKLVYMMNSAVRLNTNCTLPVLLTKDGDESFRREILTSASRDDLNYTLISRKEGVTQVTFIIDQKNPIAQTGKYFLEIPDGFFTLDGTEVKGCKLEYNMNGFNSIGMIMLDENGNPAYRPDGTKAVKGEKGIIISRGKRVIVR